MDVVLNGDTVELRSGGDMFSGAGRGRGGPYLTPYLPFYSIISEQMI